MGRSSGVGGGSPGMYELCGREFLLLIVLLGGF